MTRTETIELGGKQYIGRSKQINQKDLTSDCWMVQVWGLDYCSGNGEPKSACEYLGTRECGGKNIRRLILAGKYPKDGLPDASCRKG
jgi:hypothetical protein